MPSLSIQSSPNATEDIRLQTIWYDQHAGRDIAERYVSSFMRTADSLRKQPDLGRICHFRSRQLANLRCIRMEGAFLGSISSSTGCLMARCMCSECSMGCVIYLGVCLSRRGWSEAISLYHHHWQHLLQRGDDAVMCRGYAQLRIQRVFIQEDVCRAAFPRYGSSGD
jgi:plasmid stabilization system protein ParE